MQLSLNGNLIVLRQSFPSRPTTFLFFFPLSPYCMIVIDYYRLFVIGIKSHRLIQWWVLKFMNEYANYKLYVGLVF